MGRLCLNNPVMAIVVSLIGGGALGAAVYMVAGIKKNAGPVTGDGKSLKPKPKVREEQEDDIDGRGGKIDHNRVTPQREWRGGSGD